MNWTPLWFGKFKGKILPEVLFSDPNWFFWAIEQDLFVDKGIIEEEVEDLNFKSRNIRIPENEGENLVAEYYIHRPSNTFQHMEIVPRNREPYTRVIRRNVIDLSVPRQISAYDKSGCKNLISNLKLYLFGDPSYRMTKRRCEAFFEDDRNFVL